MPRAAVASLIGLAVTVVTFIALKELTRDWWAFANRRSQDRGYAVGLLLLGVGVGVVAIAARYHPLIAAVPAGLLFLVYFPLFFNLSVPSWYPERFRLDILVSYSPAPYLIVGVFAAAGVWHFKAQRITEPELDRSVSGAGDTPTEGGAGDTDT